MGYSACFCYSRLLPVVFQISAHLIGTGIVHTLHLGPDVCGRQTGYALGMGRAYEVVYPAILLQHLPGSCHHRCPLSAGARTDIQLLRLLVRKEQFAAVCFLLSFLPALYVCYLPLHPKGGTEEEIKYDYLVRKGDWPQIINQFHKERAESMACNGAAAVAMFKAGQIGQQELAHSIPMTKQALSGRAAAFIMSDLYMTVGLISLSQRSAFEAMESIEDFNKSGRSMVRLTECSLIFGQPEVALKYIALLEKTVFYRRWAQQMRVLAEHPEQLENHPFYGNLRKMQEQSADTFFM